MDRIYRDERGMDLRAQLHVMATPTFFGQNAVQTLGTLLAVTFSPEGDYFAQAGPVTVTLTGSGSPDYIFWKKNDPATHIGATATNGTTRITSGGTPKPSCSSGGDGGLTTEVYAVAYKAGYDDSPMTSQIYTVDNGTG